MPQTVLPSEKVIPRPLGRPGSFCQSVKICSCKQWLRYGKGSKKYDFCFGCWTRKFKEKNVFYWIKICFVVCWTKMSLILTPPARFLAKHFVKRNAFQVFSEKQRKEGVYSQNQQKIMFPFARWLGYSDINSGVLCSVLPERFWNHGLYLLKEHPDYLGAEWLS